MVKRVIKKRRSAAKKDGGGAEKAKNTAVLRGLKKVANEANAMIDRAERGEKHAFDLRLSAALLLTSARATCKEAGLKFEGWCEKNVTISYKEVKRLTLVGASDDPKLALEDMRAKTAARGRRHREKARETRATTGPGRVTHATPALPPASPYVAAIDAVATLPEADQVKAVREVASRVGLSVAAKGETVSYPATVQAVMVALKRMTVAERRQVLRKLTTMVEEDQAAAGVQIASNEQVDLKAAQPANLVRSTKVRRKSGKGKKT